MNGFVLYGGLWKNPPVFGPAGTVDGCAATPPDLSFWLNGGAEGGKDAVNGLFLSGNTLRLNITSAVALGYAPCVYILSSVMGVSDVVSRSACFFSVDGGSEGITAVGILPVCGDTSWSDTVVELKAFLVFGMAFFRTPTSASCSTVVSGGFSPSHSRA